jgi:hypothetical protein
MYVVMCVSIEHFFNSGNAEYVAVHATSCVEYARVHGSIDEVSEKVSVSPQPTDWTQDLRPIAHGCRKFSSDMK